MTNERRLGDRKSVKLGACLVDTNGAVTDVTILDLSRTGARLATPWGCKLLAALTLRSEGTILDQQVELIWRKDREAGVRFVSAEDGEQKSVIARTAPISRTSLSDLRKMANLK